MRGQLGKMILPKLWPHRLTSFLQHSISTLNTIFTRAKIIHSTLENWYHTNAIFFQFYSFLTQWGSLPGRLYRYFVKYSTRQKDLCQWNVIRLMLYFTRYSYRWLLRVVTMFPWSPGMLVSPPPPLTAGAPGPRWGCAAPCSACLEPAAATPRPARAGAGRAAGGTPPHQEP